MKKFVVGLIVLLIGAVVLVWVARRPLSRLMPIRHTGKVQRIERFHKGGFSSPTEKTRQLAQFAIIFEDGFICEGTDTALAAVKEGDTIEIRAYHDVKGYPVLDPEWWECDEGQLVRITEPAS